MEEPTYEVLFDFLQRLGFEDKSSSTFERVFEHAEMEILLVFSMMDNESVDRPVRGADLTSVEVQLQHHGLLTDSIANAVRELDAS